MSNRLVFTCLLAFLAGLQFVFAQTPPTLTLNSAQNFCAGSPPISPATTLTLTDPDGPNLDNATVSIETGYVNGEDVLTFTPQFGITGSFNATTGVLTLSGSATAAQYQTVLQSVQYQNVSATPTLGLRTLTFIAGGAIFNPANGHFYQLVNVPGGISWDDARAAAAASTYFGLQGYLVTVTDAVENGFVTSKINSNTWMGATDVAVNGEWRWVTGPEGLENGGTGRYFSQQTKFNCNNPGFAPGSSVGGFYVNWVTGPLSSDFEPNDCFAGPQREDYAHLRTDGRWNDFPLSNQFVSFYLIEYGGMPGDPALNIRGTANVTVVTPPTVGASANPATVCSGATTNLTGSGANTYVWQPGALSGTTVSVSVAANTTFTVTGTDANGCTDTEVVTVTVNNLPAVSASASQSSVCTGGSSNLTASGANTYVWNPGNLSGANQTVSPAATTTFTVTGTDGNGCTNTATITITVNPLLTITTSAVLASVCPGGSSTITANGGLTYAWQPGALTGTTITVSPAATTTFTVTGTDASGCTGSTTVTLTVNTLPTVGATASANSVCAGASSDLTASGANTYVWNPGGLTGTTVTVTPAVTTTFTVTGTDANGCTDTETITVTVISPSADVPPTLTLNTTQSFCSGSAPLAIAAPLTLTDPDGPNIDGATATINNGFVSGQDVLTFTPQFGITGAFNAATGVLTLSGSATAAQYQTVLQSVQYQNGSATPTVGQRSIDFVIGGALFNPANGHFYELVDNGSNLTWTAANNASNASGYFGLRGYLVNITSAAENALCQQKINSNTWMGGSDGAVEGVWRWVTGPEGLQSGGAGQNFFNFGGPVLPNFTNWDPGEPNNGAGVEDVMHMYANGNWNDFADNTNGIRTYIIEYGGMPCDPVLNIRGNALVDVFTSPTVTASASANSICAGASTDLTASGANTYVWSPGGLTGTTVTVTPAATTTFTVTGTDANGCTDTEVVTVTVNNLPVVSASASAPTICLNNSTNLTASGATTYLWNPGALTGTTVTVSPVVTTIFTVTGTDANGCTDTETITITVNNLPTVSASATSNALCFGSSSTLTASGAVNYVWNPGALNGTSVTVSPAATTTFTVTGTDANGCTDTEVVTINVNNLPTITPAATQTTLCAGQSTTLSVNGGVSYLWQPGGFTGASVTILPVATTTFTVTGTDLNGCTNTATLTITVNNLPTVSANASLSTICVGSSTNLTASGATTYLWQPGNLSGANQTVLPVVTTIFTVTGTDANGCTDTETVTVTVPNPVVSVTQSAFIACVGANTNLVASGAVIYSWQPGALTGSNVTVSPASTTTFTVTGTDANGCTDTEVVTITVPIPVVTVTSSATTICSNETANLVASGANTYLWQPGGMTGFNQVVGPDVTTTYTVTGTDGNGCTDTETILIDVLTAPSVFITSNAVNDSICPGGSAILTANGTATTFQWFQSNLANQISTNPLSVTVSPGASTTYFLIGTSPNGCDEIDQITIGVRQPPNVFIQTASNNICPNSTAKLIGRGAVSYIWQPTGENTDSIYVNPNVATTYTVTGTDVHGCTNTSTITINLLPAPSVSISSTGTTICAGDITTLTASGAGSFLWNTGETTSTITVNPNFTTVYSVTGLDPNGCTDVASITVTANTLPNVQILAADLSPCVGTNLTLTATGATNYVWSTGETTSGIVVNPLTTTGFVVTGTDANGCVRTASITITPDPLPAVSLLASQTVICPNESVTLTAVTGASLINWNTGETTASITVNPAVSTNFGVVVTDPVTGCFNTASQLISVNPTPILSASATPTIICEGEFSALDAFGASTYVWNTGQSGSSILVTPVVTTTYTATGTDVNGCTNTITVTVLVNPKPIVDVTASQTTSCAGDAVTLFGSGALSYVWSTGETTQNITVNPLITTAYSVTGTDFNGCTNSASIIINVNNLPPVQSFVSDNLICAGESTTLSASGAVNYVWNPGGLSGASVTVAPAVTTQFTVTGTDANGCSRQSTVDVTVNPLPAASLPSNNSPVCENATLTFGSVPQTGATYLWTGPNGFLSTSATPSIANVTLAAAGTYTLQTTLNGCSITETVSATINPTPVTPIISASAANLCSGETLNLFAEFIPNAVYDWAGPNGFTSSFQNPTITNVSVNETGVYLARISLNGCFGAFAQTNVSVFQTPSPTLTLTGAATFCQGDSAVLTATFLANHTYAWFRSGVALNVPNTANEITVFNSGTYTCVVTSPANCSATTNGILITEQLAPIQTAQITVFGSAQACVGQTVQMQAPFVSGFSYQWFLNTNPIAGAVSNQLSVTTGGSYTVEVTNATGCAALSSPADITFNPSPMALITVSGATNFCAGGSVQLSATFSSSFTYEWLRNGFPTGATSPTVVVNQSGDYSVVISNGFGCSDTSNVVSVVVNPLPDATLTLNGSATICSGGTVTISAPAVNGYAYQWKRDGFVLTGQTTNSLIAGVGGLYSVAIVDLNGCSIESTPVTVTVQAPFVPIINANTPANFCFGTTSTLTVTAPANSTFQWFKDGVLQVGEVNQTYTASETAVYSAVVTTQNGCANPSANFPMTVLPLPDATVTASSLAFSFCQGGSITLTAPQTAGIVAYQWAKDGVDILGETSAIYVVTQPGTYTVRITDLNGCVNSSVPMAYGFLPQPITTITVTGDTIFCDGSNALLTVPTNIGAQYQWLQNGLPLAGEINITYLATVSGDYSVQITGANGCVATSAPVTITANPVPTETVDITPIGTIPFCSNSFVKLTVPQFPTYTYQWYFGNNPLPNETANEYDATAPGFYSVQVINAFGCSIMSNPIGVTTVAAPLIPTVTVSGLTSICDGDSTLLTAFSPENVTYQWSLNGVAIANATSSQFYPKQAGDYQVVVTNANGCTNISDTTSINVLPHPIADQTLSGSTTFCAGDSLVITLLYDSTVVYQLGKDGVFPAHGNNINVFTVRESGVYQVRLTGANGCSVFADSVVVTVLPIPTPTISNVTATEFCQGSSVVLRIESPDTAAYNYVWLRDGQPIVDADSIEYLATESGPYAVQAADKATGCAGVSDTIIVNVLLFPSFAVLGFDRACGSDTVSLNVAFGGKAPFTLTYLIGSVVVTDTLLSDTVGLQIPVPEDVTLTFLTVANFCGATILSDTVRLTALKTAIAFVGDTVICPNSSVTLSLTFTGTPPFALAVTFNGQNLPIDSAFANPITIFADQPGVYAAILSDSCGQIATGSVTLTQDTIQVAAAASPQEVYLGEPIVFSAALYNTFAFNWTVGDSSITDTSFTYLFPDSGLYTVRLQGVTANGCSAEDTVMVRVKKRPLASELPMGNGLSPNGDGKNDTWIIFEDIQTLFPNAEVTIFNRWGSQVYHKEHYDNSWTGDNLPDGVYFYLLDLKQFPNPVLRGTVTLMR